MSNKLYLLKQFNYKIEIIYFKEIKYNKMNIEIDKYYIIMKGEKEQHALIDDIYIDENNNKSYSYSYGIMGFHEGNCVENQIRELTEKEKTLKFWELPQQFYQSFPE